MNSGQLPGVTLNFVYPSGGGMCHLPCPLAAQELMCPTPGLKEPARRHTAPPRAGLRWQKGAAETAVQITKGTFPEPPWVAANSPLAPCPARARARDQDHEVGQPRH